MLKRINDLIAKKTPSNSPNLTKLIYSGTYHKNVRISKNLSSILVEIYRIYLKRSRSKLTSPKKKLSGSRSWTNSWVICPNKNIHSVIFYSDSHAFLASSHEMDALVLLIIGTEKPLRLKSVSSVLFQISFLSWFVWFLLTL